jgi:hypothetical protein
MYPLLRGMVHRFDVLLAARNRALHYLAHESRPSDDIREQLPQVGILSFG